MWRECIGAGRAGEGLRADWQEQLKTMQDEIGFRDTGAEALWRDNRLRLVGAGLWSRRATAGETLTLPAFAVEYAVFIRPASNLQ